MLCTFIVLHKHTQHDTIDKILLSAANFSKTNNKIILSGHFREIETCNQTNFD